ncbi:membrane protein insertion efficiency factor YidD [Patescibacteria group bacterium]|nr:membrane protein insertion efficiency factor YidD [Patescibacteria group bacterium]
MFKKISLYLIRGYQKLLSPDTGILKVLFPFGACRYYPTCSEYGHQSIKEHGTIKGIIYTIWRILRCNPLSKGGYDPIIKK